MATYKLDETPDIFINPVFSDKFVYKMICFISESNYSIIRQIDVRKDKLVVYGTEINESIGSKLSDSLHLREKTGIVCVNCDGGCYIYVLDKGMYRPINNVIFDWSPFGVIVPNSVNDVLKKQLHEREQDLAALSAGLSFAKGEVEELRKQLSTGHKNEQDKEMELQKLNSQFSDKKFELEASKNKLQLSKEEVEELKEQLSTSRKNEQDKEKELQKLNSQFSDTKNKLQLSKEEVEELKEQLSSCKKESKDVKTKHLNMMDGLSSIQAELQSIRTELESSNRNMKDLESSCIKQNQGIVTELQKVQNELSSDKFELQLTRNQLESSTKKITELEEELSTCKIMEGKAKEAEMNELQSIKVLLELTDQKKADDNSLGECYTIRETEIVE